MGVITVALTATEEIEMDKLAAYEMLLEGHPLWAKEAVAPKKPGGGVAKGLELFKKRRTGLKDMGTKGKRLPIAVGAALGGVEPYTPRRRKPLSRW